MANYIEWLDAYSVGVQDFDNDHKTLIELANRVLMGVHEGRDQKALADVLDELIDYTVQHFGKEEQMMRMTGYPNYQQHREIHDELTRRVLRYANDARHERISPVEVAEFLIDWLMDHIQYQDAAYGEHFHAHGIR